MPSDRNLKWSDLRIRTEILDLLDREQAWMSASEISQALHVGAARTRKAVTALRTTGEVLEMKFRPDHYRPVFQYATDYQMEVAS